MPDSSTANASTANATEDGWRPSPAPDLAALRAELDRIDNALHDLLIARARVVELVGQSGKTAAFRPGREADIVRRLIGRHSGRLPAQTLFRMWRELLAGTTGMQAAITVAVCETDPGAVLTQLAREHFGTMTALRAFAAPEQTLTALTSGAAMLAVLPLPTSRDDWWTDPARGAQRIYVIARLPFWTTRSEGAPNAQVFVVATAAPDRSAADRSLLVLDDDARLTIALTIAGFAPGAILTRRDNRALVDIAGYVADDDLRLNNPNIQLLRPVVLGAYAEPFQGVPV